MMAEQPKDPLPAMKILVDEKNFDSIK